MNDKQVEDLFFFDMDDQDQKKKQGNEDFDSSRKTQIGIRLDSSGSNMLARIRNWCANKKYVEFLGEDGAGSAIASTDTTLARFILDAGIKALYSDVQNDELIDEVAGWFKSGSHIGIVSANLDSSYGLPYDLSQKIIALGYKRSQEIARSEEFSNVKNQAMRLDTKYEKELGDMEEVLQDLEGIRSYIENH